ncbi:hypothetical protein CathTA2_0121 [Caldalkalibacillus thermarum TA2.A1]|uniref:Uncharacterized protein n=1 Tax=Caldalkalibacillus thermarum (strain TA2.A1) TaxID=986075 RepID=F5LBD2_CALTT|nr:hypothetical protein CathTA2_0121 [Caldalkalibacillus thermarum TA2.A1]
MKLEFETGWSDPLYGGVYSLCILVHNLCPLRWIWNGINTYFFQLAKQA